MIINYSEVSLIINFDISFIVPTLNENQNIVNLYNLVVNSTRGGSAMAAAAINALLRETI